MFSNSLKLAAASVLIMTSLAATAASKKANAKKTDIVVKSLGSPNAKRGETFFVNIGGEPTTLNPITSTDLYSRNVQAYIMDGLMERNQETYEWQPELAERYEISPDGKVFTFYLRKGLMFSDGHPLTSEDVKFSFDVIFDPKFPTASLRPYFEGIEKVEAVDPLTVKFYTKTKYFGNFETAAGITVVPKHIYGDPSGAKKNKDIVGSGPYKIEKYNQGENIILTRNDKYFGKDLEQYKGRYNFDKIFMRFIKEEDPAIERLKKGELDYDSLSPEAFVKKTQGEPFGTKVIKEQVENKTPKGFGFIGWNFKRPMFQDQKVRIALAHLLNRDEINKKFRFGMSLKATGPWYQQSEYADPKVKPINYDPKKAQELLKQAGWTDSEKKGVLDKVVDGKKTPFEFTLAYANKDNEKYYTLYQNDLAKVGIKMNLKYFEWNAFIKMLDDQNFDAITLGWGGGSVDLDPKQIWHSASAEKGGSNFISYKNPEVDKLIDQAREEMDKKKRIPMLRKVYSTIAEDAPYVFMFNEKYVLYAHSKRIKQVKPTFNYSIGTEYWWIENQ